MCCIENPSTSQVVGVEKGIKASVCEGPESRLGGQLQNNFQHLTFHFGADGPQPPAGGERLGCEAAIVAAHLRVLEENRSWRDGRLQPITFSAERMMRCSLPLSFGRGRRIPDGEGGGEDGLNDGGVDVHRYRLWQVEMHQLLQVARHLLEFLGDGADVQLQFEGLDGDDGVQEVKCDWSERSWVLPPLSTERQAVVGLISTRDESMAVLVLNANFKSLTD